MFRLLSFLYPSLIWQMPGKEKIIYLSFDDGPIPEVTPWVLEQLKKRNAKATFFCIGDNAKKHPAILRQITEEGHAIGNHTYHHLNGWKTKNPDYFNDIDLARKLIPSKLFRPPYGKIRVSQISVLKKEYRIVMWDVLSKDYDNMLDGDDCYKRVVNSTRSGSIVVFHDSLKAEARLRVALPKVLDHFSDLGFRFAALSVS
ncbi:MAG: polysaccharide deacetylase family protein [Bacteroidetes bacterium]|nr:polysaccharide deacetylase family protein [Bacteroidota bacterium]